MREGLFITFEGPEGSGKSSQARVLEARLRETGRKVVLTHEPGGTLLGEALRNLLQYDAVPETPSPETETLLFAASRAQLVRTVIRPALDDGATVICDRFADSTIAYQGHGRAMDPGILQTLNAFATGGLTPDMTFLLDVPVAVGRSRLAGRDRPGNGAQDRMEREEVSFHERVRQGYLCLARKEAGRIRLLDGTADRQGVAAAVWKEVTRVLDG